MRDHKFLSVPITILYILSYIVAFYIYSKYSMRFYLLQPAFAVAVGHRIHTHDRMKLSDPIVPHLSDTQSASINKFENHKIFARVWKEAGEKLAQEMQEIREKEDSSLRRHHRKHHRDIDDILPMNFFVVFLAFSAAVDSLSHFRPSSSVAKQMQQEWTRVEDEIFEKHHLKKHHR